MEIRYVIRPEAHKTTPRLLAADLGCETRRWPGFRGIPDFDKDLFLVNPPMDNVNAKDLNSYKIVREFFSRHKAGQRLRLAKSGVPTPETYLSPLDVPKFPKGTKFIVRPYYHHGGKDYRITTDPRDFAEGHDYLAVVFPKEREYRILYVKGSPVLFWQKRPVEGSGLKPEDAWGDTEKSPHVTITDWKNSYLSLKTDAFKVLGELPLVQNAHVIAVDIMYRDGEYRVLECNTCPGLQHAPGRKKVIDAIKAL